MAHLEFIQITDLRMQTSKTLQKFPEDHTKKLKSLSVQQQQTPSQPASLECNLCQSDHPIYKCPNLNPQALGPNIIETLKQKKVCIRCLRPYEKGHKCNGLYRMKDKITNKILTKKSDCSEGCTNGRTPLHFKICQCAKTRKNQSNQSNMLTLSCREMMIVNNVPLGRSVRPIEIISLVNQQGQICKIKVLFDSGTQTTIACPQLIKKAALFIKDFNSSFLLETATSAEILNATRATFKTAKTNICIEAAPTTERPNSHGNQLTFKTPKEWQRTYGLSPKINVVDSSPDLILGVDLYAKAFPQIIEIVDNMILAQSKLTGDFIIFGHNSPGAKAMKSLATKTQPLQLSYGNIEKGGEASLEVQELPRELQTPHNLCNSQPRQQTINQSFNTISSPNRLVSYQTGTNKGRTFLTKDRKFLNANEIDQLLDYTPSKCEACKGCKKCTFTGLMGSYKQQKEQKIIYDELKFDSKLKRWITTFHYSDKLDELIPNEKEALVRFHSLERSLKRLGPQAIKGLNDRIMEDLASGFYITEEQALKLVPDLKKHKAHFTPGNIVISTHKASTPYRHCLDPSSPDKNGLTLNMCEMAGPNLIPLIWEILITMRAYKHISWGDLKKMYNQTWLQPRDWRLHQFFYRKAGYCSDSEIITILCRAITFGDVESVPAAILALKKTIETFCTEKANTSGDSYKAYIDDVLTFHNDRELLLKYRDDLDQGLAQASYKVKKWITSQSSDEELNLTPKQDSNSALGLKWYPKQDILAINTKVNFSKKIRNLRSQPDLKLEDIGPYLESKQFTKRGALGAVHILWDPLGLLAPLNFWGKTLYRRLLQNFPTLSWDDKVPTSELPSWKPYLEELTQTSQIVFPRAVIPIEPLSKKSPSIVTFFDASSQGTGTATYLRFSLANGNFKSFLLTSRNKVATLKKYTIPRSEFLSLHMAVRNTQNLKKILPFNFEQEYYIGDSQIALQQASKDPMLSDHILGPKIEEIQDYIDVQSQLLFCRSKHNPADLNTRPGNGIEKLNNSFWLEGSFLTTPESTWPVSKPGELPTNSSDSSPATVDSNQNLHTNVQELQDLDELNGQAEPEEPFGSLLLSHRDVNKSVRILSYCLMFKNLCLKNNETFEMSREKVVRALEIHSTQATRQLVKKLKLQDEIIERDGRLYLISRYLEDYGRDRLLLLSGKSHLTKAILTHLHDSNHLMSPRRLNAKLNRTIYIPRATQYLTNIAKKCQLCRKILAHKMEQLEGGLPKRNLNLTPPFQHAMADLAGPFLIHNSGRAVTTRRTNTKSKAYVLALCCMSTKAIALTALQSLSTDHLILGLMRMASRYGQISSLTMDLGTNFVSAAKIQEQEESWDKTDLNLSPEQTKSLQKDLTHWGRKQKMDFHFGTPYAHHKQGLVEVSIRELKKLLQVFQFPTKKLDILDFDTLLQAAASHLNDRPLSLHLGVGHFVSPNDILHFNLARSGDLSSFQVNPSNLTDLSYEANELLNKFHKNFLETLKQKMMRIRRWRKLRTNIIPGDVVMVLDHQRVRKGRFGLAIVENTYPDNEGIVRTVLVRYKLPGKNRFKTTERHVSSLSLILEKEQVDAGVTNLGDVLLEPEHTHLSLDELPDDQEELALPSLDEVPDPEPGHSADTDRATEDEAEVDRVLNTLYSLHTQLSATGPDLASDIDLHDVDAELDEVADIDRILDSLDDQCVNLASNIDAAPPGQELPPAVRDGSPDYPAPRLSTMAALLTFLSMFTLIPGSSSQELPYHLCKPHLNFEILQLNYNNLIRSTNHLSRIPAPTYPNHFFIDDSLVGLYTGGTPQSLASKCRADGGRAWEFRDLDKEITILYEGLGGKALSFFLQATIGAFGKLIYPRSRTELPQTIQTCLATSFDTKQERISWDNGLKITYPAREDITPEHSGNTCSAGQWTDATLSLFCDFPPTSARNLAVTNFNILNASKIVKTSKTKITQLHGLVKSFQPKNQDETKCLPVAFNVWKIKTFPDLPQLTDSNFSKILQEFISQKADFEKSLDAAILYFGEKSFIETNHLTISDHLLNFEIRDTKIIFFILAILSLIVISFSMCVLKYTKSHKVTLSVAPPRRFNQPNQQLRNSRFLPLRYQPENIELD